VDVQISRRADVLTCKMRMSECSNILEEKLLKVAISRIVDPNRSMSVFNRVTLITKSGVPIIKIRTVL